VKVRELFDMASKSSKASFLPLLLGVLSIVVSIGLYVATRSTAHALAIHAIGYLLTPIAVSLCLGWDTIDQRTKTKNDPWFEKNSTYSLILRIITGLSFVVAFPHIISMAKDIAEKLAS
jgi:hypothetical protein